ncbi:MAG TPA: LysR family transcriptional regulator [Methylomirabilota bacterium]|nr:LysR family transcriptional regulator [Methylomirabilota bacterium]
MDRNLKAFLAVAKAGNLTSAADVIGLTQPALTKTIRRLEQEFGAELFSRTTRGMVLTPIGETLLARAKAIEMHYRQAHEEVAATNAGAPREFRIAAGAAFHLTIAPDLAKQLSDEYPDTRFVLDFNVAGLTLPKLLAGEVDLMLGAFHNVPPEGIDTVEIMKVEITAFCCQSNPLAGRRLLSPQELRDARWIIYKRDELMTERLRSFCSAHLMPPPRIAMEVEALAASFRIVRHSSYLTLAPASLEGVAASAGVARLKLAEPIWNFASGAWFRQSSRRYALMDRALTVLGELTAKAPAATFPTVMTA